MNYKDYIKGKKVIFVGACPNIKGMGKGAEIDNYDVVVKTNGAVFLNYTEDYGSRIDVLYTNNQFYREMSPFKISRFRQKGIQFLCMKTCSEKYKAMYSMWVNVRVINETMNIVNSRVYGALMGSYIFTDILLQEPEELYLTGIDFFASKKAEFQHDNYQEYLPDYLPDKIRKQGNIINKGKVVDGHDMLENTKYIRGLFKRYDNLKTDDFIYKLMLDIIDGKVKQQ